MLSYKYIINQRISMPMLTNIALQSAPNSFYNIDDLSITDVFDIASDYLTDCFKHDMQLPKGIHINIFENTNIQTNEIGENPKFVQKNNFTTIMFDTESYDLESLRLGLFN